MASLTLAIAAVAQMQLASVTLAVNNTDLPDNSPAGTAVAMATVKYSDGSKGPCYLTSSDSMLTGNGCNIVTARALTKADDGTHNAVITAWVMSPPGTIICAPGTPAAKYCTPNAAALQWRGHSSVSISRPLSPLRRAISP